jgi:hydrogenase maturation protease
MTEVFLIGYGNPGRRDDGLGPAFAEAVAGWGLPGVTVETDYQLMVEDAECAARHGVVVFADAAAQGPEPYSFRPVSPEAVPGFSTHSVSPGAVMGMARQLFGAESTGYVLAIRGYDFEGFGEGVSAKAADNLAEAIRFFQPVLAAREFEAAASGGR